MEENAIQINGGVKCECKKHNICQKDYVWNPSTCSCKYGKYLASVVDHSAITCDKVIESSVEEIKIVPINFNEKNITCKTQNFYILLGFF